MRRFIITLSLLILLIVACNSGESDSVAIPYYDPGIDPDSWALVPAGEFVTGRTEHEASIDYDYEVMVTDVTNAQYADYLNEALVAGDIRIDGDNIVGFYPGDDFGGFRHEEEITAGEWPHIPLDEPGLRLDFDGQTFTPQAGYENHPMVQVTWFGAKAYCDFNELRLPTELEWEKAARGEDNRPFPWGEGIDRDNANYYSSHDIFEKIVGGLGDTTPVGFYNGNSYEDYETQDSPSPYGLYDMAGNVWQWTADVYEDQHYRYLRGGAKDNYAYNLRVWTRNSAGPQHYGTNIGFRCVREQ
jgi:formylglycine-generating enzyme required for sulfatase activity